MLSDDSKDCSAFIFRVKQSMKSVHGLLDPEDEGTAVL
jgi:hypothetical protein